MSVPWERCTTRIVVTVYETVVVATTEDGRTYVMDEGADTVYVYVDWPLTDGEVLAAMAGYTAGRRDGDAIGRDALAGELRKLLGVAPVPPDPNTNPPDNIWSRPPSSW